MWNRLWSHPCLLPFCDGTLICTLVFPADVILLSSALAKVLHPPLSSSSCRVSVLKHRGHVKFKNDHDVLGFIVGSGESRPPPHILSQQVGVQLAGWTREHGGRRDPLPAGLCSCPEPWPPAGRSAPVGFQSFSPVLPLYSILSSVLWWREKKQLRVPRLLPINMRVLFPNLSPPPFLPPTPTPAQVGAAMQRAFFFFFSIQRPMSAPQLDNFIQHARTCWNLLPINSVFSRLTLLHPTAKHLLHLFRVLLLPTFGTGKKRKQRARQCEFQEKSERV